MRPGRRVWALEGTGSFAAGLADCAGRGRRGRRRDHRCAKRGRGAKNDRIDAVRAARTALSREHQASPAGARPAGGVCAQVLATRQAVLVSRTKAINELKSLIVVAPEHLRAQPARPATRSSNCDRIEATRHPGGRHHRAPRDRAHPALDRGPHPVPGSPRPPSSTRSCSRWSSSIPPGPALLAEPGVGPVVAAQLLVSWSHPGRVRSEAAFACPRRRRAAGSQQRPADPAPAQPRR